MTNGMTGSRRERHRSSFTGACTIGSSLRLLAGCLLLLSACGDDESGWTGNGEHLFDTGAFDFAYDDAGAFPNHAPGTPMTSTRISAGAIGSWDQQEHTFSSTACVRPPGQSYGTGDGSSWAHALSGLPVELERDTRYLLAAGDYYDGPWDDRYFHHEFDEALDGEAYIGVFKATPADHGTDQGWSDALAEGPAALGPISLLTGYLIIDGQVGLGGDPDLYGIVISVRDCDDFRDGPVTFPWNSSATNVSLRHLNIQSCGHRHDPTHGSEDAIYSYAGGFTRFVLVNSYVHDSFRRLMMLQLGTDVLIEGNTLARAGLHHEAGTLAIRNCQDVAIRRNVLVDSYGTFLSLQGVSDVQIHGNVFRRTLDDWDIWTAIWLSDDARDVVVANNTFIDLHGINVGVRDDTGSNLVVSNNLWAHSRTNQVMLSGVHTHNAFFDNLRDGSLLDAAIDEDTKQVFDSSPFVDSASGDLRLSAPTLDGTALSSPFDIDLLGQRRGADGTWDRGAYEYPE